MNMYPEPKIDLSIEFCGVKFAHPFILAAAPPTDDIDMVRDAFRAGWAGAVLKTTSVEGAQVSLVNPMMSGLDCGPDRLMGMGNIDLVSEHHIDVVEKRISSLKSEFPDKRVIASISGDSKESWAELARRAREAGADLIECSFSCPQGTMGLKAGAMLGQDPVASAKVADWIKEAAGDVPVVIKLTPQVADIVEIARAVKGAGADAVCVGNTVPALMGVDLASWVPIPSIGGKSTYSGLSGPAVKPISLRCVALVSKEAQMPIAGSGGAVTWRDALEFILLGASVVEFCTAVMHYGVDIVTDLVEGMSFYLERRGVGSVREIVGAALSHIVPHEELPRGKKWRPCVEREECVRCDLCMIACRDGAHRAITVDAERYPVMDEERCTGCALCTTICPAYCIKMEEK
ncbi:MAG: NAD-dependent dihydropyrimidine dehydrogenase subunit PreA [Pseudomonadota bacterium]